MARLCSRRDRGASADREVIVLPRVIKGYDEHGYHVDLGDPSRLYATLVDKKSGRHLSTGGGISISDVALLPLLARLIERRGVFVIGNAFGYSTVVLAELFPDAVVDVIDAESEGTENALGSDLTRTIASAEFPNVRLVTGFAPDDLPRTMRRESYELVFVDGLHTDDQMAKDFTGLRPYLNDASVVIFHDVGVCNMIEGCARVKSASADAFSAYELSFTQFGVCVLAGNGCPARDSLQLVAGKLDFGSFHLGVEPRPGGYRALWSRSPRENARAVKYKLTGSG